MKSGERTTETKKKVLVTGGAGFIGSHLVPKLLQKGYSVVVLDNLYSGKLENLSEVQGHPNLRFLLGDIRDSEAVDDAFRGVDIVVHLAALTDVAASVADPSKTHEVNVTGTLNILQESVKQKVKKLIFASSTAVYGDVKYLPVKEDTPMSPISPYGASKASGEGYCKAYASSYGLNAVSLRFFNVYGLRNEKSPYSGVIAKFLNQIRNGEALTIEGDGQQTRDFVNVNDAVNAIILAMKNPRVKGKVFNVCTGVPTSISKLVETLKAVTGKDLQTIHLQSRTGDIKKSYGDTSVAALELGFRSTVSLQKGLSLLLNA